MPVKDREGDAGCFGGSIDLGEPTSRKKMRIHVVFDGVRHEMEALESFAIKFGLLTNMPVTKVKHLLSRMPARLWTGSSRSKAQGLLSLVEEAGGEGRIVVEEFEEKQAVDINARADKTSVCVKCGFPLKKDDRFCDFCQSPVGAEPEVIRKAPRIDTKSSVPPARLLFYLLVVFAAVVIYMVMKS